MPSPSRSLPPKMLDGFLRVRLQGKLEAHAYKALQSYLYGLLEKRAFPPYQGRWIDVDAMAMETGIAPPVLLEIRPQLQPLCDAISVPLLIQKASVESGRPSRRRPRSPEAGPGGRSRSDPRSHYGRSGPTPRRYRPRSGCTWLAMAIACELSTLLWPPRDRRHAS